MRFLALFPFLLLSLNSFCQVHEPPPIQFGIIPPEDLKMTVYERDSSAEAVVLCDYETVEIKVENEVTVRKANHRRVKILNKSGFDYGNITIPFYSDKKREQFFFDQAAIYFPNGNFEKIDKKDIFIEKVNDYWSQARFTFPKMEEGCVIEYSYFINSDSYYQPEDWFFQEAIPVRHSEMRIEYPQNILEYDYFFQGNEGMSILKKEDKLTILEGSNGRFTIKPGIYIFENAPAMKWESFVTTLNDYRARIRFQLSLIRHYDGRIEKVSNTWENLRKELETSEYFGHHYLRKGYYSGVIRELLPQLEMLSNQREKAALAYNYITKKISWNGIYRYSGGSEKIQDLFELGSGNSAQINLMLLVLLREADITAGPVLTSTRSHGKMFEQNPLLDQFNHMLVMADIDGQSTILDATDPLRPMGYPDPEALNGRGWHLEKGWVDINVPSESIDAFITEIQLLENGDFSGKIIGAYKGYNAMPERKHYIEAPSGKHWTNRLSEKFLEVKVEDVKSSDPNLTDQTFTDTLQFSIEQAAQVAGDLIYFSPVVYAGFSESPFKLEERNYPVDFPYSLREQHNIKVSLPEGYVAEELPKNVRVSLPNKGGMFLYAINDSVPGQLSFNITFSIKQLKYFPEEYSGIKELFDLYVDKLGEQVVLKKID